MTDHTPARRSDEQLACILYDTENWKVHGQYGKVLCEVASLHCALEHAVKSGALGHRIVALVRERRPEIVVFSSQMHKLIDQLFNEDDSLFTLCANQGVNADDACRIGRHAMPDDTLTVSSRSS
jgi:hypothetical protein